MESVMLVFSRQVSERILIGDEIVITVVRINERAVRIGIDAPKSMNIVREEIDRNLRSEISDLKSHKESVA
jgi:carbon storage regulator